MKNLITSILLLFALSLTAQDWQLDGTKYPNATNQGDTVSLATKVPLLDADNLQNYFADLGDILALNPLPDLSNYVTLNTPQTITEFKTFSKQLQVDYGLVLSPTSSLSDVNGGTISYTNNHMFNFNPQGLNGGVATFDFVSQLQGNDTFTFPNKSGTIALLDDIETPGVVELVDGANTGYVTKYRRDNPSFYGVLGNRSIDLSFSIGSGNYGATNQYSIVTGYRNQAHGSISTILGGQESTISDLGMRATIVGGYRNEATSPTATIVGGQNNEASNTGATVIGGTNNIASGRHSTAFGANSHALSFVETSLGSLGTDYTPVDAINFNATDRILNIGNGVGGTNSDAFTILKNGQTGIGIDNFEANTTGEMLQVNGNIEVTPSGGALLLRSPDGTVYELKVDNSGTLTVTPQ